VGLNFNFGKKLHDLEGAAGNFFGGVQQGAGQVYNNVIAPTSKAIGGTVAGLGQGFVDSAYNDVHTMYDLPRVGLGSAYDLMTGNLKGAADLQKNSFLNKQYGSATPGDVHGLGNAAAFGLDMAGLKGGGSLAEQGIKQALPKVIMKGAAGGAGMGGAYGLAQSAQQNDLSLPNITKNVLSGAATGLALGAVTPVAAKAVHTTLKKAGETGEGGWVGWNDAKHFDKEEAAGNVQKGKEGKYFEGSDANTKFDLGSHTLGEVNPNAHLLANYGDRTIGGVPLSQIPVRYDRSMGPREAGHFAEYDKHGKHNPEIVLNPRRHPDDIKDTIVHETQHVIDRIAGKQDGGSPAMMKDLALEKAYMDANKKSDAVIHAISENGWKDLPANHPALLAYERASKKTQAINGRDPLHNDYFNQYQRIAGEARARNVAYRREMTPEEQAAHPFDSTMQQGAGVDPKKLIYPEQAGKAEYTGQPRAGGKFAKGTQIHPEDAQRMVEFIDHVRGTGVVKDPQLADRLERDAGNLADHYGIGKPDDHGKTLANAFAKKLEETRAKVAMSLEKEKPKAKIVDTPAGKVTVAPKDEWGEGPADLPTEKLAKKMNEDNRVNTGKHNPVKIDMNEVEAGDHAKAVSNMQRAQAAIDNAGQRAVTLVRALSDEDHALVPRAIEDPKLVKTAKDPAALQAAIDAHKLATDTAHAYNQKLKGETTAYRAKYAIHDWDLPQEVLDATAKNADNFKAVNESARLHPTIEHGEAAKLTLKDRPYADAMAEYFGRASHVLGKQALEKGIREADAGRVHTDLNYTHDIGGGKSLNNISAEAKSALKGIRRDLKPNAYDKVSKTLKQTLLSLNQFHTLNIGRKAGSALALRGHGVSAYRGVRDMYKSVNKHYSDELQAGAMKDKTYDDSARIGSPIGSQNDYTVSGKFDPGKHGVGERTIFEQQLPAMHIHMARAVIADLKKRNISLDSKEARAAGTRMNEIMGFVNTEVRGLDARTQRGLGRILLAPQFTRSKWATLKGVVTDKGLARQYAIAAVLGDTLAVYGIQLAVGSLLKQKQDNWRDVMIRALIHPSIPTPFKNDKGENIEIDLPASYLSEAFGLIAKLDRGKDGRLGIDVKPENLPDNLTNYARARLNVPAAAALKLKTNESYAGHPLYDPTAPLSAQAQQAATSLIVGELPIAAQPLVHSDFVENHAPKAVGQVLKAGDSGLNPLAESAVSAVGGTARTDKTVGQPLQAQHYFEARSEALSKLNDNDKAAYNTIHPAQKNPVTGEYQVKKTVWDTQARAGNYLSHPEVLKADTAINLKLQAQGQKIDPLFNLSPDEQSKFMTYTTLNQQDPQKTRMIDTNPFITKLQGERNAFFSSLPPGDPNKPKDVVAYPTPSSAVEASTNAYFKLTEPKDKAQFMKANPDVAAQFAKVDEYNRKVRGIKNLPQYDKYPTASPDVEKALDQMNSLTDSKSRAIFIQNNPRVAQYLTDASVYGLEKSAGQAAFEGKGFDQSGLKDIYSLGNYDISKTKMTDGTSQYALSGTPGYNAGQTSSGVAASFKSSRSSKGSSALGRMAKASLRRSVRKGSVKIGKAKLRRGGGNVAIDKDTKGKPKVTMKKSLV
jgi:hypothetical protein